MRQAPVNKQGCFAGDGIVICRGSNNYFLARLHRRGAQKLERLKQSRSEKAATMALAKALADDRRHNYNWGDVLYCADYYDPIQVLKMSRGS